MTVHWSGGQPSSIWGSRSAIYVVGWSGTVVRFDGKRWRKERAFGRNLYGVFGVGKQVFAFGPSGVLRKTVPRLTSAPRLAPLPAKLAKPTDAELRALFARGRRGRHPRCPSGRVCLRRYDGAIYIRKRRWKHQFVYHGMGGQHQALGEQAQI